MVYSSYEKVEMIGCPLAEALRLQGQREEAGAGRHGVSVSDETCSL